MNVKKLKSIFEKSKKTGDNFRNLSKMLLLFPQSLIILRLALNQGQIKFGKICKILQIQIQEIEKGKRGLGTIRVNRILSKVNKEDLNFGWKKIKATFKRFQKIPRLGFFGEEIVKQLNINLDTKRKTVVLALKSIPMNKLEFTIFKVLKNSLIPFERQALVVKSLSTSKMIIIDFAIPDGKNPKVLIEVTSGSFLFRDKGTLKTTSSLDKILLGFRIKQLEPNTKSIIVVGGKTDDTSIGLLRESFNTVIFQDQINKLPKIIKGILNAK